MSRKPLSFGEKVLFIGSGFLCLSGLGASWFFNYQNELPPFQVEKRALPRPNAFDEIIAAAKIAPPRPRNKFRGSACISTNVDLEFACDTNNPKLKPYTAAYSRAFPLSNKMGYLQSARPALIRWRKSLSMPFYEPLEKTDAQYSLWSKRPLILNAIRTQARADWQRNRPDEALGWLLAWHRDACRLATCSYDGKVHAQTINKLNGSHIFRREIMDEIELLAPHLNANLMRHVALELQRNRELLPSRGAAINATKIQDLQIVYRSCKLNDLRVQKNFKHPGGYR